MDINKVNQYINKAEKMLAEDENQFAMISLRQCLEYLIMNVAKSNGLAFDTKDNTLEKIINELSQTGFIDRDETAVLHNARRCCNKGAHVDLINGDVDRADALEALTFVKKAKEILCTDYIEDKEPSKKETTLQVSNRATGVEYYYSKKHRSTYGAFLGENFLLDPKYLFLKEKADGGDVSAMMDLAIGFIDESFDFTEEGIIHHELRFKDASFRDSRFNKEISVPSSYYYWILRAGEAVVNGHYNNSFVPFVPTTLLECIKIQLVQNIRRDTKIYWFDKESNTPAVEIKKAGSYLINLLERGGKIAPIHQEQSANHIRFLIYGYSMITSAGLYNDLDEKLIDETICLDIEDVGKPVTIELLEKRSFDSITDHYVDLLREEKIIIDRLLPIKNQGEKFDVILDEYKEDSKRLTEIERKIAEYANSGVFSRLIKSGEKDVLDEEYAEMKAFMNEKYGDVEEIKVGIHGTGLFQLSKYPTLLIVDNSDEQKYIYEDNDGERVFITVHRHDIERDGRPRISKGFFDIYDHETKIDLFNLIRKGFAKELRYKERTMDRYGDYKDVKLIAEDGSIYEVNCKVDTVKAGLTFWGFHNA